ncbi:MAG: D-alanyl-D-alanine carboxypeptidase/D-alanyl-D-alanine-endopeptidase [Pseudomonadota bacterium]
MIKAPFYVVALSLSLIISGCGTSHRALFTKTPATYSYIFGEAQGSRITADHNADIYITPASCLKVLTAALAYKVLGADYRYETKLYQTKKGNKIEDVVISFAGDPTFSSEDLEHLFEEYSGRNVSRIILNRSLFKTPDYSNDIIIGDIGSSYAGPVSAASIDGNALHLLVTPGVCIVQDGFMKCVNAEIVSDTKYKLSASVATDDKPTSIKLTWCENSLHISGNIKNTDKPRKLRRYIRELDPYLLHKTQSILNKLKIRGKIMVVKDENLLPKNMQFIKSHRSRILAEIVPPAFKSSDNFVFDAIYLTLVHTKKNIKEWSEGSDIIKNMFKESFDLDLGGALIVDGSGLSRYNKIQTKQLYNILTKGSATQEFVESFARPGDKESTAEKRTDLPEGVRVKTGALLGVKCLCGYDSSVSKAFAIVVSGYSADALGIESDVSAFVSEKLR